MNVCRSASDPVSTRHFVLSRASDSLSYIKKSGFVKTRLDPLLRHPCAAQPLFST